eukprot:GGOE01005746.1.p1 GENE.GGOE01005746.1~~GGOE01005746.1.p1  ORF type:complete len:139 (+),score=32.50 GGOE01005746.1:101-517(+)
MSISVMASPSPLTPPPWSPSSSPSIDVFLWTSPQPEVPVPGSSGPSAGNLLWLWLVGTVVGALLLLGLCVVMTRVWLQTQRAKRYLSAHELDLDDIAMLQMDEWEEDEEAEMVGFSGRISSHSDDFQLGEVMETIVCD